MSDIEAIVKARGQGKAGLAIHRPIIPDFETIGVIAERVFSQWSGEPMVEGVLDGGDPGWDFDIRGLKVDVKGTRRGNLLLVDPEKVRADVFVLVKVWQTSGRLIGWAWRDEVLAAPIDRGERFSYGKPCHVLYGHALHLMESFPFPQSYNQGPQ